MAKPLKIALVILGLFVTLVVVAAVGLVMTFDPNDSVSYTHLTLPTKA